MDWKTDDYINSLTVLFKFSDEEEDALRGFIPMTQEIFNSCMDKCFQLGSPVEKTFQKLILQYPEFLKKYLAESPEFPYP